MSLIKFKKQIFMGNGQISMAEAYHIHNLVEECLEEISDIQQEASMGYGVDKDIVTSSEFHIQRNVRQIVMALTGKDLPKNFFKD